MNYSFSKSGGLVVNTKKMHFCIFPANVMFAKSKRVLIIFWIGFVYNGS